MHNRIICLIFYIAIILTLGYSSAPRLYPFINEEPNTSFFTIDAGTGLTLSLVDNNVEISTGYDFFITKGIILSSDLYIFERFVTNKKIEIKVGLGGGIIFTSTIENGFDSNMFLRVPLVVGYNNFYLKLVPMVGTPMFKSYFIPLVSGYAGIGYKFDLYKEKAAQKAAVN